MEWQYSTSGDSTGRVPVGSSLPESLNQMCSHISSDVLPSNDKVEWDYLRVELWLDSGRIIVFPASTKSRYRIEKAACQIIIDEVLQRYEQLADSDIDDGEFTGIMEVEEQKWIQRFLEAARKSQLRGYRIIFFSGGSETHLEDTTT